MYDMQNIQKLKALEVKKPEAWRAFAEFNDTALADGAIPRVYKELMALLSR
jgi:hypothetical protein